MSTRTPLLVCLAAMLVLQAGCTRKPTRPAAPSSAASVRDDDPASVLRTYGVAQYPRSQPVSGISVARLEIPEGTAHVTAWRTKDPAAMVIAFYAKHLTDPVIEKTHKQMVVGRNRAGNSITVVAAPEDGRTRVTITVR